MDEAEENQFVVDDVNNIVKDIVETLLGSSTYSHNKVNQWTNTIVENTVSTLTKLQKAFKYVVTCTIMQKTGGGLHMATSCHWDSATDGTCSVRWESKTMYCIVSVFGMAI